MRRIRRCLISALVLSAAALAAVSPAEAARQKKPPVAAAPAKPAEPVTRSLGKADSWAAYLSQDQSGRVCYLVGQPKKSEPAGLARKPPVAMVTHRPVEQIANVVSFVEGYPLKEGSDAVLEIGDGRFELFTKDDSAWARTAELDKAIVMALAKGGQAVVKGQPHKGPATTDVYALSGFAKALALIDKACGVKRESPAQPARHAKRKHSGGSR